MKIKQLNELKTKEVKDLEAMVSSKKLELMKNAVKIAGAAEKNLKVAWKIKKEIAQILSLIENK